MPLQASLKFCLAMYSFLAVSPGSGMAKNVRILFSLFACSREGCMDEILA